MRADCQLGYSSCFDIYTSQLCEHYKFNEYRLSIRLPYLVEILEYVYVYLYLLLVVFDLAEINGFPDCQSSTVPESQRIVQNIPEINRLPLGHPFTVFESCCSIISFSSTFDVLINKLSQKVFTVILLQVYNLNSDSMNTTSNKDIRHVVVKNQNESQDANVMAELEHQRNLKSEHEKRNRMEQFLNTTKLNASKVQKQQQEKKQQTMNAKKLMFQKQKELKNKYTHVDKKKEAPRSINVEPTKVDWKRVDPANKGVKIPQEKPVMANSDDEGYESAIDSQFEHTTIRTPVELMKERQSIRNKMLNKRK